MSLFNAAIQTHFQGDPQLLLLDLDGTLINSIPDLTQATDAMLQALGQSPAGVEQVTHWVGNGVDALVRRALAKGDEALAQQLTAEELQRARVHFDAAYLQALTQATGAYPGVEAWLAATAGIPKVLITNKARMFTEPLLRALNWLPHFQQVLCGDDFAEKKPSPLPLLHACEAQQIPPHSALMIGDSNNDIRAAQAANMASVAVTYGYNYGQSIALSKPTWTVDNLLETLA